MDSPLVSCIMPTANRPLFFNNALNSFLTQDYENKELIVVDDGNYQVRYMIPELPNIKYHYSSVSCMVGTKRNLACTLSSGEIIIHLDDDDWYAPDWITRQVNALITCNANVTGLKRVNFYDVRSRSYKQFFDGHDTKWLYGATLAYWKSYWKRFPFGEMQIGEDNDFVLNNAAKIYAHDYCEGYLGLIHGGNISIDYFDNPKNKLQLSKWIRNIQKPCPKLNPVTNSLHCPLVSCIMPTANRHKYVAIAISNFLSQDYPNKELIIIDDGRKNVSKLIVSNTGVKYFYCSKIEPLGDKRNFCCEKAKGEIIVHWDDDDWYAPDWISNQINSLSKSGADITGLNQVQFYSPINNKSWMIRNSNSLRPWLTGATLCYRKSFWIRNKFKPLQIKEDDDFVRNSRAKVIAHDYYRGFIAILHRKNTTTKEFENPA